MRASPTVTALYGPGTLAINIWRPGTEFQGVSPSLTTAIHAFTFAPF